jgi:hypothetical protein
MTSEVVVGIALIASAVAFNLAFARLASAFDYPDILRREPAEILERFGAGGTGLVLRWWVFLSVAVAFVPVAAAAAWIVAPGAAIAAVATAVGAAAGLVQAIGLVRWPFLIPELARRHAAAATTQDRATVELLFVAVHRLLGVAIGEHLGYLLTGVWTIAMSVAIASADMPVVSWWLAIPGVIAGLALAIGSLEFVGAHEREGWPLAERLVPVAYVGWSAWLVVLGIALIV